MANKDFQQRDKKQQPPQAREQQRDMGSRKNTEEVGEPIQLDDDKMKQGQQKPDMGRREGQQGGDHHKGGQHQGNR